MTDLTKLQFIHTVSAAFVSEKGKVEMTVWAYHTKEDADKRFARLKEMHDEYEKRGQRSPVLVCDQGMLGIYDNFEQSLLTEGRLPERVN